MLGRIVKGVKEFFDVCVEEEGEYKNQIIACNSKGVFRKDSLKLKPLAGDLAEIEINRENRDETETFGIITKICERKNFLRRPPVANLDVLFVVVSVKSPSPSYFFTDKLTAMAVEQEITPIIVINKTDLCPNDDSIYEIYAKTGFKTIKTNANEKSENSPGFEKIKNEMRNAVCVFAGESGVGKSSIINRLFGNLKLGTGLLSDKIKRGKHTTRTVEFFKNDEGGYVADTPGFGALDFDCGEHILKENLIFDFPDLLKYAKDCQYSKCAHIKEEGCKVLEAVDKGEAADSRHASYAALYEILKNRRFK
ncbi:MAG: ribosome small subunit-dependent GTPase A [Oscillospiraceae bacterium]|nr:ribosome small subunit-dependent GTPase A [Oscillospiraceae bacterium]